MNEGNIPGKNEALISLILGIVGLVVALFVNGIFGMILGIAGLVVSSRSKSMGYNDSLRTAGFVLSVLSVVLGGITLVACIACTAYPDAPYQKTGTGTVAEIDHPDRIRK